MKEDVWLIKLHHCNYCCSDTSIGYLHLWWTSSSSPPQCSALPSKYSQAFPTFNSILQETESWVGTQEQGYDVSQHQTLYKIDQCINKVIFQALLILSIPCSTRTHQCKRLNCLLGESKTFWYMCMALCNCISKREGWGQHIDMNTYSKIL